MDGVELRASTSTLLLVSMSRIRRIVVTCNLRGVHGPVAAVDILTRPTLGAPRRALFPRRRWRAASSPFSFLAKTVSFCDLLMARAPHLSSKCVQPLAGDADVRCSVRAKRGRERVSVSST